ncbi:MAG: DnaD domain protein [Chloroflexi bacterium]|nr:DnaD domain protein [Chloroflexota bacterium]
MTRTFDGFPPGKTRHTQIPALFFSELLPQIDDLGELKVTLFCFWALHQKEGKFRFLRQHDFCADAALMSGLPLREGQTPETSLRAALARAVARGTLLQGTANDEALYFMNTAQGREALRQLQAGTWQPDNSGQAQQLLPERPNIYALYEANIGMMTPLIADWLKDAEHEYPADWLAEAIHAAVANNKRSWNYIKAILKRWQTEGRGDAQHEGVVERNGQRKIAGNIEDFIKR